MKLRVYIFLFLPLSLSFAQADLSGYVTYPDSVGINLVHVQLWQNDQQLANTITDSVGYYEIDSISTGVTNDVIPSSFEIYPNYPSPFDKTTNIIYELNKPEDISITIYNIIGQKITTLTSGYKQKGTYVVQWDGRNSFGSEVVQGIYFARLDNGRETKFIKMLKMNGALNATGTSAPGNFYNAYKVNKINEDYLIRFIDMVFFPRVNDAELTVSLPAHVNQVLYEQFIYTGPTQIAGVEGEQIAVAKFWFQCGTEVDSIELMNTDVWTLVNDKQDSLYFATIDTTLNGQVPLKIKTTALHRTVDTTAISVDIQDIVNISGSAFGVHYDSTGAYKLPGAMVNVREFLGPKTPGDTIATTFADENGNYSVDVPLNNLYFMELVSGGHQKKILGINSLIDPRLYNHVVPGNENTQRDLYVLSNDISQELFYIVVKGIFSDAAAPVDKWLPNKDTVYVFIEPHPTDPILTQIAEDFALNDAADFGGITTVLSDSANADERLYFKTEQEMIDRVGYLVPGVYEPFVDENRNIIGGEIWIWEGVAGATDGIKREVLLHELTQCYISLHDVVDAVYKESLFYDGTEQVQRQLGTFWEFDIKWISIPYKQLPKGW